MGYIDTVSGAFAAHLEKQKAGFLCDDYSIYLYLLGTSLHQTGTEKRCYRLGVMGSCPIAKIEPRERGSHYRFSGPLARSCGSLNYVTEVEF